MVARAHLAIGAAGLITHVAAGATLSLGFFLALTLIHTRVTASTRARSSLIVGATTTGHRAPLLVQILVELAQLNFLVFLDHLIYVTLKFVWHFDAEHERAVPMVYDRVWQRVRINIRIVIVDRKLESIQSHAHELLLEQEQEELLERLVNAILRHRNLPQDTLLEIRMTLHDVAHLVVVLLGYALQYLLQNGYNMRVEV